MKGREFISFFSGVTAARPIAARAQQMRRVGAFLNSREQDFGIKSLHWRIPEAAGATGLEDRQ